MEKEKKIFENFEKEPQHNEVMVDFLRHGKTEYTDEGRDLTLEGEAQIRESAAKIIEKIDQNKERVVLWSSPAKRAQGSEEIIKELLVEKGIEIYRNSEIGTMRNFDHKNKEIWEIIGREAKESGISPSRIYSLKEADGIHEFETQEDVRKRAETVFNSIRYLAEHANLEGKKLHIIGVSHAEFLNPIIGDIFGPRVEDADYMNYGENVNINFDYNPMGKEMVISAEFRGERKENIVFDKEKRKFIIKEYE